MPPLSKHGLERLGELVLQQLCPEALTQATRIDLVQWVDVTLQQLGIHVYPASSMELQDNEAVTIPDGVDRDPINILLTPEDYHNLDDDNRARATAIHELSHAILHVPLIRRRVAALPPGQPNQLPRVRRSSIKAYRDPEWQAWMLGGCILMPRTTIKMLDDQSPANVATVYGVSASFAATHLRRLGM